MWEAIKSVLVSPNALFVLVFLFIFCLFVIFASKKGLISINTGNVRIGYDERELTIVRNQSQWAYLFIMSLKGKLIEETDDEYRKCFIENILEKVYDKVVEWITFNHLSVSNTYIEIKQSEIKCLVYSQPVKEEFKTPEFECRMNNWVKEAILNLVKIRKEYSTN